MTLGKKIGDTFRTVNKVAEATEESLSRLAEGVYQEIEDAEREMEMTREPAIGRNINATRIRIGYEVYEGHDKWQFECVRVDCSGLVMISRDPNTFHIRWDSGRCTLCGQAYEIIDPPKEPM